jgi:hypothetical protein
MGVNESAAAHSNNRHQNRRADVGNHDRYGAIRIIRIDSFGYDLKHFKATSCRAQWFTHEIDPCKHTRVDLPPRFLLETQLCNSHRRHARE